MSAGESHSAAITEKQDLFTWGNGGFGRLGHELDINVYTPQQVIELAGEAVTYVSCGAFHTIAVT